MSPSLFVLLQFTVWLAGALDPVNIADGAAGHVRPTQNRIQTRMAMETKQRTYVGVAMMLVALAYTVYAALTYSGLYLFVCDLQDRYFGSHDTTLSFIAVLVLCCLPTYFVVPELWKRRLPAGSQAGRVAAGGSAANPRVVLGIGVVALLIGVGAGAWALYTSHRTPVVRTVMLGASPTPAPGADIAGADRLVIDATEQDRASLVLTETVNGSATSERYTPLTGPRWTPAEPIQYVMREGTDPSYTPPREVKPVHFGPAAIFRHAIPGEIRTGWERHGLTVSSSVLVLDQNLEKASWTAWIICFFGVMLGLVWLGLGAVVRRKMGQTQHS